MPPVFSVLLVCTTHPAVYECFQSQYLNPSSQGTRRGQASLLSLMAFQGASQILSFPIATAEATIGLIFSIKLGIDSCQDPAHS